MRLTMWGAAIATVAAGILGTGAAHGQEVLEGDKRLACEAIICLSTSTRPSECRPSLKRYFDIRRKRWDKTVEDRLDFLQLCPRSDSDAQFTNLIRAQSRGAGKCDAAGLNAMGYHDYGSGTFIIPNVMPSYCAAYVSHPYTYNLAPTYHGTPGVDGRWYDPE